MHIISKWIKTLVKNILIRKKFPKSKIHSNLIMDNFSILGENSVVFDNVVITDSKLGDFSYIQSNSVIIKTKIGKFCSIACNVSIGLPQHSISGVSSHPIFYLKDTPLPKKFCKKNHFNTTLQTNIGHDVWIGQSALIMTGISIGTGAVIGAGAVVTKDVESYAIVGGVPAKFIKYRFGKKIRERLIKSKWWDLSFKQLKSNISSFNNPTLLLDILTKIKKKNKE